MTHFVQRAWPRRCAWPAAIVIAIVVASGAAGCGTGTEVGVSTDVDQSSGSTTPSDRQPDPSTTPSVLVPPGSIEVGVSRDEVIEKVRLLREFEITEGTEIQAKLIRWSDLAALSPPDEKVPGLESTPEYVWLVYVNAPYRPAMGKGETLRWGAVVVNPNSAQVLSTMGGAVESGLPGFGDLVDQASA